ncbi:hypothetical protein F5883DRAFT_119192 [Diaporthe sp. PMI_573]|nr:hypothetical protein F5883DRAFT_119192 [Diaporthaceae sp. PMI_573]
MSVPTTQLYYLLGVLSVSQPASPSKVRPFQILWSALPLGTALALKVCTRACVRLYLSPQHPHTHTHTHSLSLSLSLSHSHTHTHTLSLSLSLSLSQRHHTLLSHTTTQSLSLAQPVLPVFSPRLLLFSTAPPPPKKSEKQATN